MGWTGCARVLLFVFNFIFWLSGGGILALGIYLLVTEGVTKTIAVLHIDGAIPLFDYAAYILIAFGGLVFLVGFCGCCGALRKSQCLLGFYITFLVIVMLGEMAVGILTILYKDQIKENLEARVRTHVKVNYGAGGDNYIWTQSLDYVQTSMGCCGADGPKDWETSVFMNSTTDKNVPMSCCPDNTKTIQCQAQAYVTDASEDIVSTKGCLQKLSDWFRKYTIIIIGVGFGIAGLEIFGLIFAICLCREARKESETY